MRNPENDRAAAMAKCYALTRVFMILLLMFVSQSGQAEAVRRALLIGVSELPGQAESTWLMAPRHDVQLMRSTLLAQGWAATGIQTIADGVPGAAAPRLDAIRAALARLVEDAAPGELVLLYFSGHGARLSGETKRYLEPDGLTEVFLAQDGTLRDVEIGGWIQALLAKGAFVWSVFDTCSATSMTRGRVDATSMQASMVADGDVRFRGLSWTDLGGAMRKAALVVVPQRGIGPPETSVVPPARYVAFFAAESHQMTPELRLPRGQVDAQPQGLLTWAIAAALKRQPATWRALFNDVLAMYLPVIDELAQRFPSRELPSPVIEGVIDGALFDSLGRPASTQPVWLAQRQGDVLVVAAGLLDGLQPGQTVRLTAQPPTGAPRETMSQSKAVHLNDARVDLPAAFLRFPEGTLWQVTPLEAPRDLALRVQADGQAVRRSMSSLSLTYPASIRMVSAAEAEWNLVSRGAGYAVVNSRTGVARELADAAALRRHLTDRATARWLDSLASLPDRLTIKPLPGFTASLVSRESGVSRQEPLAPRQNLPARSAGIEIVNASGASVDLLVVGIAPDGRVVPIFPISLGETNRFERGDAVLPARKRFELPPELLAGGSAVLVLATPVRPRSPARLFGFSPSLDSVALAPALRRAAPDAGDMAYVVMARW